MEIHLNCGKKTHQVEVVEVPHRYVVVEHGSGAWILGRVRVEEEDSGLYLELNRG